MKYMIQSALCAILMLAPASGLHASKTGAFIGGAAFGTAATLIGTHAGRSHRHCEPRTEYVEVQKTPRTEYVEVYQEPRTRYVERAVTLEMQNLERKVSKLEVQNQRLLSNLEQARDEQQEAERAFAREKRNLTHTINAQKDEITHQNGIIRDQEALITQQEKTLKELKSELKETAQKLETFESKAVKPSKELA